MIFTSLKDFEKQPLLKVGDRVIFSQSGLEYLVSYKLSYLIHHRDNNKIFTYLGLSHTDMHQLVDYCYGYKNELGSWPECKEGDATALTRLVKAIFYFLEHGYTRTKIVNSLSFSNLFEMLNEIGGVNEEVLLIEDEEEWSVEDEEEFSFTSVTISTNKIRI